MTTAPTPASRQPLTAIDWQELIAAARASLAPASSGTGPSTEVVRRAVSTAYYAAFHALTASNADSLIRQPQNTLTRQAWTRTYKALDHRLAREQLQANRQDLAPQAQVFADVFRDLRNERYNADYNPQATVTVQMAANWINRTEAAVRSYLQLSTDTRAAIAMLTLTRSR